VDQQHFKLLTFQGHPSCVLLLSKKLSRFCCRCDGKHRLT